MVDVIRGFAALSVLIYHVIEQADWIDFPSFMGLVWFRHGWMGVDIFFVISGFVVTFSALSLQEAAGSGNIFFHFMGRRIRRIVPLYYATLIAIVVLSNAQINSEKMLDLVSHLLFLHNLFPDYHRSINAVAWTLGAEMQFYILLAITITFVNRNNLKYCLGFAIITALLWRFWSYWSLPISQDTEALFIKATQLPGMLDLFAIGAFLALFVRSSKFTELRASLYKKLFLCLASVIMLTIAMKIFLNYQAYWPYPLMVTGFRTFFGIAIGGILLFFCAIKISSFCHYLLSPLAYIGVVSYGVYLFHWPILQKINNLELSPFAKFLLVVTISIGLASLSWHFFEKKFLKKRQS